MPPQKPLPTSSEVLPDKAITREKLGRGAIVVPYLAQLIGFIFRDTTELFCDLVQNTIDPVEANVVPIIALSDGMIRKIVAKIPTNSLTANVTLASRINGVDQDTVTIKPTDIGSIELEFNTPFKKFDSILLHSQGNNAGFFAVLAGHIILEYDG